VKSGTIREIFWLLPVLSPLLLVVSHFSFVSTWKRSHFSLWFQSSGSPDLGINFMCTPWLKVSDFQTGLTTLETRGSAHWVCIAHLTIEWYWSKFQREIIITLKNSSHLEWRVGLSDTILKGTHPGTIYARFGPYIDASCQVWLHLAKLFQRRRFC
jgi:hypothetical protein